MGVAAAVYGTVWCALCAYVLRTVRIQRRLDLWQRSAPQVSSRLASAVSLNSNARNDEFANAQPVACDVAMDVDA